MATVYKILGQANPPLTSSTDLYTVPAGKSTVCSTLNIANLSTINGTFRLSVVPSGSTLQAKNYLAYNTVIPANDSISLTIGMTLGQYDKVKVYASSISQSFNLFGTEIS
jgi:hypothetical protein